MDSIQTLKLMDENDKLICEGVIFTDGRVVVRWIGKQSSIVVWQSLEDFEKISVNNKRKLTKQ